MPSIRTNSRALVDLQEPQAVEIRDVAHGLSLICRFNGQTPVSYSVAQHSLAVSFEAGRLAKAREFSEPDIRLTKLVGLLHDAHEYLCGDVSRPMKQVLGAAWSQFEAKLQRVVLERLGLRNIPQHIRDTVKDADDRLLAAEFFVFFGVAPLERHHDVTSFVINPWSVTWTRSKFLKVYEQLTASETHHAVA